MAIGSTDEMTSTLSTTAHNWPYKRYLELGQNGVQEVPEPRFGAFSCDLMHFWLQERGTEKSIFVEITRNCQGRRPLDSKKKYIVGCQKSVTKPNAERVTSVTTNVRLSFQTKCTVIHSSGEFPICRVFKGHYELPKKRCQNDVRKFWVDEKIFFRSTIFSKNIFFRPKKSKNRVGKKKFATFFFASWKNIFSKSYFIQMDVHAFYGRLAAPRVWI